MQLILFLAMLGMVIAIPMMFYHAADRWLNLNMDNMAFPFKWIAGVAAITVCVVIGSGVSVLWDVAGKLWPL